MQRDAVVGVPWNRVCRHAHRLPVHTQRHNRRVALHEGGVLEDRPSALAAQPQLLEGLQAHVGEVVPAHARDGLGQLLQPGVVGEASVVDRRVGREAHFVGLDARLHRREVVNRRLHHQRRLLEGDLLDGLCCARQNAVMHALAPHGVELRFGREFRLLPVVLHQLEGLGGRAVQLRHHLQRRARIGIQRVNQRLLNRYRAVERPYIAPCLERVAFGQVPHAQRRGLVDIHPVMHAERRLRDEFAELEVNGRVVSGVRAAQHNQHFDGVVGEVLRQLANLLLVLGFLVHHHL